MISMIFDMAAADNTGSSGCSDTVVECNVTHNARSVRMFGNNFLTSSQRGRDKEHEVYKN